jgi:hypothetical protein
MAAVCRSTCGETRFCNKEGQFFRATAAYLVTRYWTESELRAPPRALGNKILEASLPCSLVHAARRPTVGFAKGVHRSFRPFP